MSADARAIGFERGAHVWMYYGTQREEPVDSDGVARDAERQNEERNESSKTHSVRNRANWRAPADPCEARQSRARPR